MKALRYILLLLFFTCSLLVEAQLRGNAKSVVITPPLELGYTLGGYGARMSKPAEGVHDDIVAKAIVLSDGSKKFAIVTMDVLGFPPNMKPMIVDNIGGSGWSMENILLLPSHSHSSLEMFALNDKNVFNMPAIGVFQKELLDFVVDRLSSLISETEQNLVEVKTGTGQIVLDKLNRNRRGSASVDRELTVTRVDKLNGESLAMLVNWTAHPTIMDEHDMLVSGGWPGYLQRELEGWIGNDVVAMYYNGAEGDQSVIASRGASHFEKAEHYGRTIATHAFEVYNDLEVVENEEFEFGFREVQLPANEAHPSFMQTGGAEYQLDESSILGLLNQVLPRSTHITSFHLGELLIVGAPGEMTAVLGMDIKTQIKKEGIAYPVIGGLANEWISYILTEEEYGKGGYEASVSFYGPRLGEVIHREMLNTARELIK